MVTEGYRVPTGQAYVPVESPCGEPALVESGLLADLVPTLASLDTIMGGVDR